MHPRAKKLIELLELTPHPEGGYFKEVYRSNDVIPEINRNYATSIYFLLTGTDVSHFHRIQSDECWYFHEGDSLRIHSISPNGNHQFADLGLHLQNNEKPFHVVNAKDIFGSHLLHSEGYALVSCAVSPGFDFNDFELFTFDELVTLYPKHELIIQQLTP